MHYYSLRFQYFPLGIDRACRKKINQNIEELNNTIHQLDLQSILFYNSQIYIILGAYGTFPNMVHSLGYKISYNEFKKIEIVNNMWFFVVVFYHNGLNRNQ